jgi:hypothetical protein
VNLQQRYWLVLPLLAAHLLVVDTLLSSVKPRSPAVGFPALIVVQLNEPSAHPPAPPSDTLAIKANILPPAFDISAETPDGISPSTKVNIGASDCALSNDVQAALQSNPSVQAALDDLPQGARSPSDALMLWDGNWTEPEALGGDANLAPIRSTVIAIVAFAPAACRDAAIAGPRLLFVGNGARFTVLGFGSGVWAWSQLIAGYEIPPITAALAEN